jgi:hypothetical protein
VGLVWYETNSSGLTEPNDGVRCPNTLPDDAEWHVHYGFSADALAPHPVFTETLIQEESVATGKIGKPQAEVLEVAYLSDGRAVIAYPTGTLEQGKSMFAIQTSDGAK